MKKISDKRCVWQEGSGTEKELTTYDRGKCRKLFFCNFIKGEMKIKSIKILKTSYLFR